MENNATNLLMKIFPEKIGASCAFVAKKYPMSTKCNQCSGSGYVQTSFGPKPCPSCGGSGRVEEKDSSSKDKPLVDTSDWRHDGS